MRKDPDALKNWSVESNLEIAATQRELIESAFHALRPGGTLVYSTCTLNREENESVLAWLKETWPEAVEFLPLGDLFPEANQALTAEGFLHVFPQIYDGLHSRIASTEVQSGQLPLHLRQRSRSRESDPGS